MNAKYTLPLAMVGSFALGAIAVQTLHAQTKPLAYGVAEVVISNQEGYAKEFLPPVRTRFWTRAANSWPRAARRYPCRVPNRRRASSSYNGRAWIKKRHGGTPLPRRTRSLSAPNTQRSTIMLSKAWRRKSRSVTSS
jgi:hypothetical protein